LGFWCIDGSSVRASRAASGALRKVSANTPRNPKTMLWVAHAWGFGSKFHLVTDGRGLPLAVEVTAGQRHESTQIQTVLDGISVPQPVGRPRK